MLVYHLKETVVDKWGRTVDYATHEITGNTMADIWKSLDTEPRHLANLKRTGKTSFRDIDGLTHHVELTEFIGPN
jgi:hypothetical protein